MTDCPICLSQITSGCCETECGHRFHSKCIFESLRSNASCPICRGVLRTEQKRATSATMSIVELTFQERTQRERHVRRAQRNFDARRRRLERKHREISAAKQVAEDARKQYEACDLAYKRAWEAAVLLMQTDETIVAEKRRRVLAMRRMARASRKYKSMVVERIGERPSPIESFEETLAEALSRMNNHNTDDNDSHATNGYGDD